MSGFDGLGPLLNSVGSVGPWQSAQNAVYVGPGSGSDPLNPYGFTDLLAQHERAVRLHLQAEMQRRRAELWTAETRRYWSGPDKFDRQLLRAYRVPLSALGLVPRSVFTSEYRRRQRARVKRRPR